jgi:hypothetical protein
VLRLPRCAERFERGLTWRRNAMRVTALFRSLVCAIAGWNRWMLRLLTFRLYPNAVQPNHGISSRLGCVISRRGAVRRAWCTGARFPFPQANFGRYGEYALHRGRSSWHGRAPPPYPSIPKVGMNCRRFCSRRSACKTGRRHILTRSMLTTSIPTAWQQCQQLARSVVITARGSDVNSRSSAAA